MVKASTVKVKTRYEKVTVIYDGGDWGLSVARIKDKEGNIFYGIRHNGNDTNKGHPVRGKNPLWFELPKSIEKKQLLDIINVIISDESHEIK